MGEEWRSKGDEDEGRRMGSEGGVWEEVWGS